MRVNNFEQQSRYSTARSAFRGGIQRTQVAVPGPENNHAFVQYRGAYYGTFHAGILPEHATGFQINGPELVITSADIYRIAADQGITQYSSGCFQ